MSQNSVVTGNADILSDRAVESVAQEYFQLPLSVCLSQILVVITTVVSEAETLSCVIDLLNRTRHASISGV